MRWGGGVAGRCGGTGGQGVVQGRRWVAGGGADGERETGDALSMHGSRKK